MSIRGIMRDIQTGIARDYRSPSPVLQGAASMPATNALRELHEAKTQWPYPWTFAPPGAVRVTAGADSSGTLVVPTVAAGVTQGLLYTVDQGFYFALEKLVVVYIASGAPGVWNPGDALWSMDVNRPVGITSFQGSPVQGFTAVDVPLGSLQIPWPLECPEIFKPNDAIRIKFTNVNLNDGVGNYFKSILLGWRWPVPEG